jgi:hypothetical protein
MVAEAVAMAEPNTTEAKYDEARRRLTDELQKIADEVTFLDPDRPEWKPRASAYFCDDLVSFAGLRPARRPGIPSTVS